jgi:hypothetical protein
MTATTASTEKTQRPIIRIVIPRLRRSSKAREEGKIRLTAKVVSMKLKLWLSRRSTFTKYFVTFGFFALASFAIAFTMYTAAYWALGIPIALAGYPTTGYVVAELTALVFSLAAIFAFIEAVEPWFNF